MAAVDDVLTTIDAFGAALRAQDPTAAETVWSLDRADVAILGAASGERFIGPDAVRLPDCAYVPTDVTRLALGRSADLSRW